MVKKVRGRRRLEKDKKEKEKSEILKEIDVTQAPETSNLEIPNPFYGLVDPVENGYFKEAETKLNVNLFENEEDKELYIGSIFEECKGKELKLITNQITSKLIERIILNGNSQQIKGLFRSFSGNFVALSHHKYASHCLETLIVRSASLVEKEVLHEEEPDEDDELYTTVETLIGYMLNELNPYLKEMVGHQYASHVLRVILLVLGGKELPSTTVGTSVLRSKRSKVARKMIDIKDSEDYKKKFQIPENFKQQLDTVLSTIRQGQTRESLRNWALEKIASPVLQLIIQIEGIVDKERKFYNIIFLPHGSEADTQEGAFIEYCLSDAVGSHFLEAVVKFAVQKNVTRLYTLYMKERLMKLVKRSNTGLFVVEALLHKLGKGEVKIALDQMIPEIGDLIDINLDLGKSIIDASRNQRDYKKEEIIAEILKKYSKENMIEDILKLQSSTLGNTNDDWPTAEERWRALFLQKLVEYDTKLLDFAINSIMNFPQEKLVQMCFHGVFSHVVESLLVPTVDVISKRKLSNCFRGKIDELACNAYGSHVVDKLWDFTVKLTNYKEIFAQELYTHTDKVKESTYGKQVWKNWSMDMYVRKPGDWKFLVKEQEKIFMKSQVSPDKTVEKTNGQSKRSKGHAFDVSKKRQRV